MNIRQAKKLWGIKDKLKGREMHLKDGGKFILEDIDYRPYCVSWGQYRADAKFYAADGKSYWHTLVVYDADMVK